MWKSDIYCTIENLFIWCLIISQKYKKVRLLEIKNQKNYTEVLSSIHSNFRFGETFDIQY